MGGEFVSPAKRQDLQARMERLGLKEPDLVEKFVHGSGPGGQKINKSSTCVYLKHPATGVEVKCQQSRSREVNRFIARRELVEELEARILRIRTQKQAERERIRRQKRRRSRRQKERMLQDKRMHAEKKRMRGPADAE